MIVPRFPLHLKQLLSIELAYHVAVLVPVWIAIVESVKVTLDIGLVRYEPFERPVYILLARSSIIVARPVDVAVLSIPAACSIVNLN